MKNNKRDTFAEVVSGASFPVIPWKSQGNKIGSMGPTSFSKSNYIIKNLDKLKVNDVIHVTITARDENGRMRVSGGDFWYATLSSEAHPQASIAGKIIDHKNGTYNVYFLCAWAGGAQINITLVHPSLAITFIKNVVWNQARVQWTGTFVNGTKRKNTTCRILSADADPWNNMCEYPSYQSLGKTSFMCQKRDGFDCSSLSLVGIDGAANDGIVDMSERIIRGHESLFDRFVDLTSLRYSIWV